jgi:YggT family protein
VGVFLSQIVNFVITILVIAIIVRALLSFAPLDPYHPIVQFVRQFTEPFLQPIRNLMPQMGMIDLSPMIAILLLTVIGRVLQVILISLFP